MTDPGEDQQEIVPTPFGDTYVRTIGRGPHVFVIHGGPGFDHGYLVNALAPLAIKRTLIFYDQLGCGRSGKSYGKLTPSLNQRHFRWLAQELAEGNPVGVIAHSWGALVLIGSLVDDDLSTEPMARFNEGLLINPVPVSARKYQQCAKNLLSRIPLIERIRIFRLAMFERSGEKIMKPLLPYYVEDRDAIPSGPFPLDKSVYRLLNGQLHDFDYAPNLKRLPNLSMLMGMRDFTTPELLDDLLPHISSLHKMENIGHFPFWEAPEEFEKILTSVFR